MSKIKSVEIIVNFLNVEFTFIIDESMLEEFTLSSTSDYLSTIKNKSDFEKYLINENKKTSLLHVT